MEEALHVDSNMDLDVGIPPSVGTSTDEKTTSTVPNFRQLQSGAKLGSKISDATGIRCNMPSRNKTILWQPRTVALQIHNSDGIELKGQDIVQLTKAFFDGTGPFSTHKMQILILHGLTGCGKSTAAEKVVEHCRQDLFWIQSTSVTVLGIDLWNVCDELSGLTRIAIAASLGSTEVDLDTAVQYLLCEFRKRAGWIMVFDDVTEETSGYIDRFAQTAQKNLGHIIITTKLHCSELNYHLSCSIFINTFLKEEATQYVKKRRSCDQTATDDNILLFAKRFCFYPLPLVLATEFLQMTDMSIVDYLKTEIESVSSVYENSKQLRGEVKRYMDEFNSDDKTRLANEVLNICSHFCPEKIPLKLFYRNLKYHNALKILHKHSLLSFNKGGYACLHESIQIEVLQLNPDPEDVFLKQAIKSLEAEMIKCVTNYLTLGPGILSLNDAIFSDSFQDFVPHYFRIWSKHSAQVKTYFLPIVLKIAADFLCITYTDLQTAIEVYTYVAERLLDESNEQPRIIRIYRSLGETLRTDLRASTAWLEKAEQLLVDFKTGMTNQILERELGAIYLGMARNLIKSSDFENAEDYLIKSFSSLDLNKDATDCDRTLKVSNLMEHANLLERKGLYSIALQKLDECYKLKPSKHDLAAMKIQESRIYNLQNNFRMAHKSTSEALDLKTHTNHLDLSNLMHSKGHDEYFQGNYSIASVKFCESLQIRIELFGPNNAECSHGLRALGNICDRRCDSVGAVFYASKAFTLDSANGISKPSLAMAHAYRLIGCAYERVGKLKKAVAYLILAQNIARELVGEEHVDYAVSTNQLATVYDELGMYSEALDCCQHAHQIRLTKTGAISLAVAASLRTKAKIMDSLENHNESSRLYYESLHMLEETYQNEFHISKAAIHRGLGYQATVQTKFLDATDHYLKAIEITEKHLKDQSSFTEIYNLQNVSLCCHNEHIELAVLYQELGSLYSLQGHMESLEMKMKSGEMRKKWHEKQFSRLKVISDHVDLCESVRPGHFFPFYHPPALWVECNDILMGSCEDGQDCVGENHYMASWRGLAPQI